MKRLKQHRNTKSNTENFDQILDEILNKSNLKYSDLDFSNNNADVLKSYNELNKKINQDPNYLKNFRHIISSFNFNLILKPLYTIILTTIVILTIIELKSINGIKYAEVTVNEGEKIKLHITNDVSIWVNSESKVKIPLKIKRNPTIHLEGEAYFEINQENRKAIKVISQGVEIKALKASFNINSKNGLLVTNIKSGEAKFRNPELPKSTEMNLEQNDQVLYNPAMNFIAVEKTHNLNYLTWHTGKLNFNDTPMYKAIQDIYNYYEIPIAINNKNILKSQFNAQFENAEIDEILDKIRSTFNCQISGDGSKIVIH